MDTNDAVLDNLKRAKELIVSAALWPTEIIEWRGVRVCGDSAMVIGVAWTVSGERASKREALASLALTPGAVYGDRMVNEVEFCRRFPAEPIRTPPTVR